MAGVPYRGVNPQIISLEHGVFEGVKEELPTLVNGGLWFRIGQQGGESLNLLGVRSISFAGYGLYHEVFVGGCRGSWRVDVVVVMVFLRL